MTVVTQPVADPPDCRHQCRPKAGPLRNRSGAVPFWSLVGGRFLAYFERAAVSAAGTRENTRCAGADGSRARNIEDRRGQSGGLGGGFGRGGGFSFPGSSGPRIGLPTGGRGGGIGIVGIIIVLGILWFAGINPLELLNGGGSPVVNNQPAGRTGSPADEEGQFVAVVLADTEDTWGRLFQEGGQRYREPTLVLFEGQVNSACGFASAATGPFYCPGDQKLYIDLSFFDELSRRFGAPGDFAQAYVIAHEVGHHVQNLLGILPAGRPGAAPGQQDGSQPAFRPARTAGRLPRRRLGP